MSAGAAPEAQGLQTGAIEGTVVDVQQAAIPTATVTLRSAAMQGARTAIPRANGSYNFEQLPAGDYQIVFEAPRFASVTRSIVVHHRSRVNISVMLRDEQQPTGAEQITETPAALSAATVVAQFRHDEVAALPSTRTLLGIAQLAPGFLTTGRRPNINGAVGYDSDWTIDGVDITDNQDASPQNLFIEDAIDETTALTAGLSAEYGRFAGGLVSAVTRSGGNQFHASYRLNLDNPSWTAQTPFESCDPAVTATSCVKTQRPDTLNVAHEATIGGPVAVDRVWFFGAGRLQRTTRTESLPLSGVANDERASNPRGQLKLTASPATGHTLTVDALTSLTTEDRHVPFSYTVDPRAIGDRSVPNYYYLFNYRGAIGNRAFIEAQAAERRFERRQLGAASTAIVDSPMLARSISVDGSPAHYNAPYFDAADPEKRNSYQGTGAATYLLTTRAGDHVVKGGYEFFRSQLGGGGSQSPTGYVFATDYLTDAGGAMPTLDASGRFIPLWVPGQSFIENWLPLRGAVLNIDTQSVYVQDRWRIGRFSADLGVRHERVHSDATDAFTHIDSRTTMPRLAAGYNLDEGGSHTVHVSYGRYAGRFPETQVARNTAIANPDLWLGVYVGPAGQGRSFTPAFDTANYLTIAGRFPRANVRVADDLQPPAVNEFTASYGTALRDGRGFVEAAFVGRTWDQLIDDDISIANGTTHVIRSGFDVGTFTNVVIRNRADAVRDYRALEFQGRYRMATRWSVNGTYTLQLRDAGNAPGEDTVSPAIASELGDYPEIFTIDRHAPDGPLPAFERHRGRAWSTYSLDFGRAGALSLSGLLRIDSGRTYSLAAVGQPLTPIQDARLAAAGYPDRPASQTIFFGRGAQQFSGSSVIDFGLTYTVPTVRTVNAWLKLDVFNALNNQKLIAWDTTVVPDVNSAIDALGLRTGYTPSATFGKAISNEDFAGSFEGGAGGRSVRLAIGIRF